MLYIMRNPWSKRSLVFNTNWINGDWVNDDSLPESWEPLTDEEVGQYLGGN
jgi:hypothetical protein